MSNIEDSAPRPQADTPTDYSHPPSEPPDLRKKLLLPRILTGGAVYLILTKLIIQVIFIVTRTLHIDSSSSSIYAAIEPVLLAASGFLDRLLVPAIVCLIVGLLLTVLIKRKYQESDTRAENKPQ